MTTEALRGTIHDPAHISPSNLIRRIGERYSRYLFSPNPLPLNIQREGPTQRDKEIVNNRNASPQEPKGGISSRDVFLVAGTSISTVGLTLGGQILINRVFGAEHENINSFPNSFNNGEGPNLEGLPPQLELSPAIDPRHPERVNVSLFGLETQGVKVEWGKDPKGGGIRTVRKVDPNTQEIIEEKVTVRSSVKINGLNEGDPVPSLVNCEPPLKCTIAAGSTKKDKNGVVNPGGFTIEIEDAHGNHATILMRTTAIKLTQDIPPSQHEQVGNTMFRLIKTPVPIEANTIANLASSSKDPFTGAQIYIEAFSTVTGEDGTQQLGPADIVINNLPSANTAQK